MADWIKPWKRIPSPVRKALGAGRIYSGLRGLAGIWGAFVSAWWVGAVIALPLGAKIAFGVAGVFLIMAVAGHFGAWLRERKDAKRPSFSLKLLGGNVFVPTGEPTLTGFALVARIHNTGGPSFATNWCLNVVLPGGAKVSAQLTSPPPTLTLPGSPPLTRDDFSLEDRAGSAPLLRDDPPIESRILFYADILKPEVVAPDTVLELTVEDVDGRCASTHQRMGDWLSRDLG